MLGAQDAETVVRRVIDEVLNEGRYGAVDELVAADYLAHAAGMSLPPGPEAVRMSARLWREAFPDYRVSVDDLIVSRDRVVCRYQVTGTHRRAFQGIPATGKAFRVAGVDVHRVVGGKLVESWPADCVPRVLLMLGALAHVQAQPGQWT